MNILILGASGKIGKSLSNLLNKKNFINLTLVGSSFNNKFINSKIRHFQIDLYKETNELLSLYLDSDIIINCIGEYKNSKKMSFLNYQFLCTFFDKNKYLIKDKEVHWIQLSSIGVYRNSIKDTLVDENSYTQAMNLYETTKLNADNLLFKMFDDLNFFEFTIVRPSIVFGSTDFDLTLYKLKRVLSYKVMNLVNFDNVNIPFIHINDLIRFIHLIIVNKNKKHRNQTYNISGNYNLINFISAHIKHKRNKFYHNLFTLSFLIPIFTFLDFFFKLNLTLKLKILTSKNFFSNKKIKKNFNFELNESLIDYNDEKNQ
jgi:nucleoside-diphosphate-sugar epimerase